jgi:hypothetical protein
LVTNRGTLPEQPGAFQGVGKAGRRFTVEHCKL